MDSLFSLAHRLLTYGLDGSPIYVDEFTRLNREVYEQALELYGTRGKTVESEAELCLGLLAAFAATIYDNGHKQQYIQRVLDRSWEFFLNCLHLCSKFNFLSIVIAKFMMKNCQGKLIALLPLGIRQN